ncbi:copper amine oxidase N-terminal domain-containing protein [Cohnella cholangitidis]|nr:copper amine oxidase N-terminal domain-containing protein [Cohnella cholangitidis]
MSKVRNKVLFLFITLCLCLTGAAGAVYGEEATGESAIASVLEDGTPLLKDGSIWLTSKGVPLQKNLNLVSVTGDSNAGYGINKEGKLVQWSGGQEPSAVSGVANVKQVSGESWLLSDGTLWTMDNGAKKELASFKGTRLFDEYDGAIAALSDSGELKRYESTYRDPALVANISDASSIRKLKVRDNQVALLYEDGRVILYDFYHFDNDMKSIPETLATDGVDIGFGKDSKLLVVKKDGTAWNNGTGLNINKFNLTQIAGVERIDQIIAAKSAADFYARQLNGAWVSYREGKSVPLVAPRVERLSFVVSSLSPTVGGQIKGDVELAYNTGATAKVPWSSVKVSIDNPYLIQSQGNGSFKSLGVGEATITVEASGIIQSVKVASSLKNPLQNAKQLKGITYLPVKSVFQALGGTVSYNASAKSYSLDRGTVSIVLTKGSAKAKINGKTVTMKGAPIDNNGELLFSSDLLSQAFGAKLQWDSAKQQMTVSIGAGKLIVLAKQQAATAPSSSGSGKMYETAATGSMAGWKILKGHRYEKSLKIYFTYKNGLLMTKTEDIRSVNLNKKVTWIDDSGKKRTNTVGEVYGIFQAFSGQYTDDWFAKKFGTLYSDWLLSSTVDAAQLVEEYLQSTGQMKKNEYPVTLTPDAQFE